MTISKPDPILADLLDRGGLARLRDQEFEIDDAALAVELAQLAERQPGVPEAERTARAIFRCAWAAYGVPREADGNQDRAQGASQQNHLSSIREYSRRTAEHTEKNLRDVSPALLEQTVTLKAGLGAIASRVEGGMKELAVEAAQGREAESAAADSRQDGTVAAMSALASAVNASSEHIVSHIEEQLPVMRDGFQGLGLGITSLHGRQFLQAAAHANFQKSLELRMDRWEESAKGVAGMVAVATAKVANKAAIAGVILLALLLALVFLAALSLKAHAQVDCVTWKTSADGTVAQYCAPFKVKAGTNISFSKSGNVITVDAGAGGSTAFDAVTTGVNVSSTMTLGTGGTLTFSGSGIVNASKINGVLFSNGESLGKIPIGQGDGTAVWSDPLVQGTTAHDAAGATTNPVAIGGYASAAAPANVSLDGDIVRTWHLRNGAQVVNLAAAGALIPGDATNGLKVQVTAAPTTAVTGTFWQATQPVSGTFWQATQPISAAANVPVSQATATSLRISGGDAAGTPTAGTVLAVQGIASGTALPVSGTFWQATQPVSGSLTTVSTVTNLSQQGGVAISLNTGVRDTGTQRVTIATNDSVPVTGTFWQATQAVSGTVSANATLTAETTKIIGTVRAQGNLGAAFDAATGAAPPANVVYVGGLTSGAVGGLLTGIPVCDSQAVVNISTISTTLIVTGVASRHVRICAFQLLTAAANNVAFLSGTGATCGTGTAGMTGGTTAASGFNFAANGGIAQGSGLGTVMRTVVAGDSVCIITSAATQLSGTLSFTIY